MKALTLWRPWSDAMTRGPKRVENRIWPPPERLCGHVIALHGGKKYDAHTWNLAERNGYTMPSPAQSPEGIVGVARLVGALEVASDGRRRIMMAASLGDRTGEIARRLWELDHDPWWAGPVGWLIDEVVAIDAVPCRGAQGLWNVPADVEAVVLERVRMARAA